MVLKLSVVDCLCGGLCPADAQCRPNDAVLKVRIAC